IRRTFGGELRIAPYAGNYYYGYNLTQPPFKDNPKLREALALAIDRELIVSKVMNGVALPAYGWVPPGMWNYTPQQPAWAAWTREQRIARARQLYAEAGYDAQHPAQVEIRYNTHEDHKRIAVVIAAMWKQYLGVQATLVNEEFKVFLNNRKLKRATQAFRASWVADYDDASAFSDILRSTHGENDSGYVSAAYDALLAQAAVEPDVARRRELLQQAERQVLTDWPVLPIYYYVSKHLVKSYVQGWEDNILDYHYSKDLRIAPH
ncbi:MAG TPA: ABC transporter substrate-binding protein, partial [Nevskiaceae bacterium]|nr:ABC transporter substrate-binding protein [Nevskiaceae bacterium]